MHVVSSSKNKKVLIGIIGYHNLRNHSVGPIIQPQLEELEWPEVVDIKEMNWGPIAITQEFESMGVPYSKVVFLCALERPGREVGEITCFKWNGLLPSEKQIQACIGDAVTGVVSIENLLIIGEHFDIWPQEVYVVDVEPGPEQSGPHLTPKMEAQIPAVVDSVRTLSLENEAEIPTLDYKFIDVMVSDDG